MDQARVFGAVQSLERSRAGTLVRPRVSVEADLERFDETIDHGLVARHFFRRHLAGPELANHLLREDGIPVGFVSVERREVDTCLQRVLVMTGDADLLDERIRIMGLRRPGGAHGQ